MDVAMQEYVNAHIANLQREMEIRFDALQRAVDKADAEMSLYKQGANEWRAALRDQSSTFITRTQVEDKIAPLTAAVHAMESRMSNYDGRTIMLGAGLAVFLGLLTLAFQWFLR